MKKTIKFEKITEKKLEKILTLNREYNKEYFQKYNIKDNPSEKELNKQKKKIFTRDIKNNEGIIIGVKNNEDYIGFIFAIKGLPQDKNLKSKGYISDLFVKKEFRKKRIAEQLIKETILWFKKQKINEIFIDVNIKNNEAKNLYKKLNFKEQKLRLTKKI